MQITPLEIRKFPFRTKTLNGLDPDHVDSFLQQIASQVEEQTRENTFLASKLKDVETQLDRYKKIDQTLSETLLTAQRATDDARMNAQKEAELIIREAQVRADRYESESRERVYRLESEIRALSAQKESFISRFRSFLTDQIKYLDVMAKNLDDDADKNDS
ncbi:MAG: DivIVA domain-containing protein [Chitinispirillales bacterium]|jgi:cell division initiation protein|nr:DivIVA domain-containing protein [Chitinispirillales bacterium]